MTKFIKINLEDLRFKIKSKRTGKYAIPIVRYDEFFLDEFKTRVLIHPGVEGSLPLSKGEFDVYIKIKP